MTCKGTCSTTDRPMSPHRYTTTATVALAAVAAFFFDWTHFLELLPGAGSLMEPWRLLTGHLVHGSTSHLLWDVATFTIVGAWLERRIESGGLARLLLLLALAISAVMLVALPPGLSAYRGLSGIDSGLFVFAALLMARGSRGAARWLPLTMIAAFAGKAAFEYATGSTLFASTAGGMVPVPLAHLVGGAAAVAWFLFGGCVRGAVANIALLQRLMMEHVARAKGRDAAGAPHREGLCVLQRR